MAAATSQVRLACHRVCDLQLFIYFVSGVYYMRLALVLTAACRHFGGPLEIIVHPRRRLGRAIDSTM